MGSSAAPAEVKVIHDPQSEAFFGSGRNASGQKITVQGAENAKELFFKEDYQNYNFLEHPDIFFRIAMLTQSEIDKIVASCNFSQVETDVLQPFIESAKRGWFAEREFQNALDQQPGIQKFIDRFLYVEQVDNATQKRTQYQKANAAWGIDQVAQTLHTLGRKEGQFEKAHRVAVHVYQEFLGNHSRTIRSVLLSGCHFESNIEELNFLSSLRKKSLADLETSTDENIKNFLLNLKKHKSALVQLYKAYIEGAAMGYVPDTQDALSDDLPYPGLLFNQNIFLASSISGEVSFKLIDFGDLKSDILSLEPMQKLRDLMMTESQTGKRIFVKSGSTDQEDAAFSFSEWYLSALRDAIRESLSVQRPRFGYIDFALMQKEDELYQLLEFDEGHKPTSTDYLIQYVQFVVELIEQQVVTGQSGFKPINKVSEDIFFVAKLLGMSDLGI